MGAFDFVFFNSYMKDGKYDLSGLEKYVVPTKVSKSKVTVPVGKTTPDVTTERLTHEGNVPLVTQNSSGNADEIAINKKYLKVDLNKLPQKNTFYNTLEQ